MQKWSKILAKFNKNESIKTDNIFYFFVLFGGKMFLFATTIVFDLLAKQLNLFPPTICYTNDK